MADLNLSSSTLEKKSDHKNTFGGSWVIAGLFLLILMGWGGLYLYLKALDQELASLNQTIAGNELELRGEAIDRVARFDRRLSFVKKQLDSETVEPYELLGQLERLVIPKARLIEYVYNVAEKSITVSGETDNFMYVAKQILSFKSEVPFSNIRVDSLKYTKDGRINFSFKAKL